MSQSRLDRTSSISRHQPLLLGVFESGSNASLLEARSLRSRGTRLILDVSLAALSGIEITRLDRIVLKIEGAALTDAYRFRLLTNLL